MPPNTKKCCGDCGFAQLPPKTGIDCVQPKCPCHTPNTKKCEKCGAVDDSGLTPRTNSVLCDQHDWKPTPAVEDWEERYKTMAVFETYSVPKIVIDDTLDFIRSHDQQLRQRIVEALEEKKIGQNVVINAVGRSIGQNNVCEAEKMNTYNQAITDAITFITNLK